MERGLDISDSEFDLSRLKFAKPGLGSKGGTKRRSRIHARKNQAACQTFQEASSVVVQNLDRSGDGAPTSTLRMHRFECDVLGSAHQLMR